LTGAAFWAGARSVIFGLVSISKSIAPPPITHPPQPRLHAH
jgi:hypothetical protein